MGSCADLVVPVKDHGAELVLAEPTAGHRSPRQRQHLPRPPASRAVLSKRAARFGQASSQRASGPRGGARIRMHSTELNPMGGGIERLTTRTSLSTSDSVTLAGPAKFISASPERPVHVSVVRVAVHSGALRRTRVWDSPG